MKHSTVDYYAENSFFYALDPRAKIIGTIIFVVSVSLLQDLFTLLISLISIATLILISNIPMLHILKRYTLALPFIIFASISIYLFSTLESSLSMFIRISACVLALIFLSTTTPFFSLLKGLQSFHVPRIFIVLLLFTYKYLFIFEDELQRMKVARKARCFKGGRHLFDRFGMRTIAFTAGMIFVRAYERGDRIYDALRSRGYTGEIKTVRPLKFKCVDYTFCFALSILSIFLLINEWWFLWKL